MITSRQNPLVKSIRGLQNNASDRREMNSFVVEGIRLAEEALLANWPLKQALYSQNLKARGMRIVEELNSLGIKVHECSNEVMAAASDTKNPQGLLLELEIVESDFPRVPEFILILDAIQDPGNVGSLLRSASGAGLNAVLLAPECADPYSPKVLRSAMGAHFRLPVRSMTWEAIRQLCKQGLYSVFSSDVKKGQAYHQVAFRAPLALILGGEAQGVGVEGSKLAAHTLHIPMQAGLESLNAAAAGAVLLFEIHRQLQSHRETAK